VGTRPQKIQAELLKSLPLGDIPNLGQISNFKSRVSKSAMLTIEVSRRPHSEKCENECLCSSIVFDLLYCRRTEISSTCWRATRWTTYQTSPPCQ
jgi:hypothetical protein